MSGIWHWILDSDTTVLRILLNLFNVTISGHKSFLLLLRLARGAFCYCSGWHVELSVIAQFGTWSFLLLLRLVRGAFCYCSGWHVELSVIAQVGTWSFLLLLRLARGDVSPSP